MFEVPESKKFLAWRVGEKLPSPFLQAIVQKGYKGVEGGLFEYYDDLGGIMFVFLDSPTETDVASFKLDIKVSVSDINDLVWVVVTFSDRFMIEGSFSPNLVPEETINELLHHERFTEGSSRLSMRVIGVDSATLNVVAIRMFSVSPHLTRVFTSLVREKSKKKISEDMVHRAVNLTYARYNTRQIAKLSLATSKAGE